MGEDKLAVVAAATDWVPGEDNESELLELAEALHLAERGDFVIAEAEDIELAEIVQAGTNGLNLVAEEAEVGEVGYGIEALDDAYAVEA